MKTIVLSLTIIGSSIMCAPVFSQGQIKDSLGLPGDNLNLYGVLDIFQQSKTLEEFEGKLNAQDSKINNLDLNGDNKIDYIKVVDNVQGTSHAIVLKDEVNEKEMQDMAVIEVDKDKDGKINIQIVGDEDMYGKNYIVEPKEIAAKDNAAGTPNPGYTGGQTTIINNTTNNYYDNDDNYDPGPDVVYYPVHSWYMWDFLYAPTYVVYVSPWHWGYYPHYWHPWSPYYWHEYYGFHYHHYGYFHRGYTYRSPIAHGYYGPRRTVSVTVNQGWRSGTYNKTYGRRDLLTKSVKEGHEMRGNKSNNNIDGNGKQGRGERKNNSQNDNLNKSRNNNNNKSDRINEPKNNNREKGNAQPRNENKVNRQEGNKSAPRQTRTERKASKAPANSAPRSNNNNNKSGGGGKKR